MPGVLSVPVQSAQGVDSFQMLLSQYNTNFRMIDDILSVIGLLALARIALPTLWEIISGLRAFFWSKLWKKSFAKRYGGNWAVVTGCTDGIGRAYCNELAKDGLNIVLVSRNMDKLRKTAREIVSDHHVEVEVVQVDFAEGGPDIYTRIEKAISDKTIAVLVNNVGVMTSHPKYYIECTDAEIWSHINVNMASVAVLCKMVLPKMIQRGRGAIVNIASIAAVAPIPLLSIYAASKAFVEYLSLGLNSEYYWNKRGITIQTVTPAYVSTNMTSFSDWTHTPSLFTPTPAQFAASAVSTIGYKDNTTGYWVHGIMKWTAELLPRSVYTSLMKVQQQLLQKTVKGLHKS